MVNTTTATRDPRPFALSYERCTYFYGSRGWRVTAANVAAKRSQYKNKVSAKYIPVHYEIGTVGLDCIGLVCIAYSVPVADGRPMGASDQGMMYYLAKNGVSGNAFMDAINAEAARKSWGCKPIASIPEPTPEMPGILVFTDPSDGIGHIGILLGTNYKNPVTGKVYKGKCAVEATSSGTGRVQVFPLNARGGSGSRQWKYWAPAPKDWREWAGKYWGVISPPAPEKTAQEPAKAASEDIRDGDRVRIKQFGVEYFPGGKIIQDVPWLRDTVFTVNGLGKQGKPAVPCARLLEIISWCAMSNLEKVED